MKVLTLGYDHTALDKNSILASRLLDYGSMVERFVMVVPLFGSADNNIKQINLGGNVEVYGIGSRKKCLLAKLKMLWRLKKLAEEIVSKEKIDVVSAQDPSDLGLVAWRICRQTGAGLHLQEHGDVFSSKYWRNESVLNFIRFYLGRFIIKKADSIRVVSERIGEYLAKEMGVAKDKILSVPIVEDINESYRVKSEPGLRREFSDKFIYLSIGRFVKQKNLPMLLRAFKAVAEKHSEALLVLVGEGPLEDKLKQLAAEEGIADKVKFYPWTDNIYKYYCSADAYVLSSNYEGWARVIIEAAYAGLPIIMTDVGCAREVIVHNESGLITDVGDEKEFSQSMEKMLVDEDARKKISQGSSQAFVGLKYRDKDYRLSLYKKSWEKALRNREA